MTVNKINYFINTMNDIDDMDNIGDFDADNIDENH
jgi:hypothetical protein